jgi:hypothetical protein
MAAAVDAARLLTWRAAWMARHGKPLTRAEGSMTIGRAVTGLDVR